VIVDTKSLLTRRVAAELYGVAAQGLDYLMRRGYLRPVFSMGHTKLFLRRDILAVKKMNLRRGRPKQKKAV